MSPARERIELEQGYVLHQRAYRESSALLEIFTAEHGRVGLVARGVRSARSRQRGELQAFRPLRLSWQLRGELGTLTGVETGGPAVSLSGRALYSAFYLNELLLRLLTRSDPCPDLFLAYQDSLNGLGTGLPLELVLRRFEIRLLQESGYGLPLDCDTATGKALVDDGLYDYHLESGPVEVDPGTESGFLFRGASLLAMAQSDFSDISVLQDAKRLLRAALRLYLGDKPLKSRELFRAERRPTDPW